MSDYIGDRIVLPWPDSEGPHWLFLCSSACRNPVLARLEDGVMLVQNAMASTDWFRREEAAHFGAWKFVKVIEQNPFTAK